MDKKAPELLKLYEYHLYLQTHKFSAVSQGS